MGPMNPQMPLVPQMPSNWMENAGSFMGRKIRELTEKKANPVTEAQRRYHRQAANRSGFTGSFEKPGIPYDPFETMNLREMRRYVDSMNTTAGHSFGKGLVRAEITLENALKAFDTKIKAVVNDRKWSGRTADKAASAVSAYHQNGRQVLVAIALLNERASDLAELMADVRQRFPEIPADAPAAGALPQGGVNQISDSKVQAATLSAYRLLSGTYRSDAAANDSGIPVVPEVQSVVSGAPDPVPNPGGAVAPARNGGNPPASPKTGGPGSPQPPQQVAPAGAQPAEQPQAAVASQPQPGGQNPAVQAAGHQSDGTGAGITGAGTQQSSVRPGTGAVVPPGGSPHLQPVPSIPPAAAFGPPVVGVPGAGGPAAGAARPPMGGMPGMAAPRGAGKDKEQSGEHKTAAYLYNTENGRIAAGLDAIPPTAPPVIGGANPQAEPDKRKAGEQNA